MARLGFLGLGIMGYPMARNLIRAGHEVALWSNTARKAVKLAAEEKGGLACGTPRQVAENAEYVFLCVGDTDMSEAVVFGSDGLAEGAKPGTVIVDASTISPSHSIRTAKRLHEKGILYLEAPCTGSKAGAEGGTLTFMVGGDEAVYEKVKPYFQIMGKQLYYCGAHGLGLAAKLSQNLILSNILQAFNEGMVLAVKAGMNAELMLDILNNSAARSGLVSLKGPAVFNRDFSTNFSLKWMLKDVGLILEHGAEQNVPLPTTAATQQQLRAAVARGYGEEDMCSSIKALEEIAGVQVKKNA